MATRKLAFKEKAATELPIKGFIEGRDDTADPNSELPPYVDPPEEDFQEVRVNTGESELKFSEDQFVAELMAHIDTTYDEHYAGRIQPIEYIMSNATTLDYLFGNVIKYVHRYGKKGGYNDKDLYKAVHFIMMMAKYSKNMPRE